MKCEYIARTFLWYIYCIVLYCISVWIHYDTSIRWTREVSHHEEKTLFRELGKYSFDTDSAHHLPTYIESELKIIGLMGCTLGLICSIEPRNWFFAFSVGHIVALYMDELFSVRKKFPIQTNVEYSNHVEHERSKGKELHIKDDLLVLPNKRIL